MCLAIPGKVIETFEADGMKTAKVSFGGMVKQVCLEAGSTTGPHSTHLKATAPVALKDSWE